MPKETMTPMERMEAAVKLEPLDRIPCAPLMDIYFPAVHKGWSVLEALTDWKRGFYSIVDVYEEVGGWDGMLLPGYSIPATPHAYSGINLGKNLIPGIDLDQTVRAPVRARHLARQGGGELGPVDGLDDVEQTDRVADLVGL